MITKIHSINGLGIFNGESSFEDGVSYKKHNIIYGYNGSGKTSLSRALRFIETKEIPDSLKEDDPRINIKISDSSTLHTVSNDKNTFPIPVRVFNSDFIWENISWSKNEGKGIVTVSKSQKDLIKKKEVLKEINLIIYGGTRKKEDGEVESVSGKESEVSAHQVKVEDFLKIKAYDIKKSLWCSNDAYNKSNLRKTLQSIKGLKHEKLSENEEIKLIKLASSTEVKEDEMIASPQSQDMALKLLHKTHESIKVVASRVALTSLKESTNLEVCVKNLFNEGHLKTNQNCPACNNIISEARMKELRGHFSTEVDDLEKELRSLKNEWKSFEENLPASPVLEKIHIAFQDKQAWESYDLEKKNIDALICRMSSNIDDKVLHVDEKVEIEVSEKVFTEAYGLFIKRHKVLEEKIQLHNDHCKGGEFDKYKAEEKLTLNAAVNMCNEYILLINLLDEMNKEFKELLENKSALENEINELDIAASKISESCSEINKQLKGYLGHDRFQINVHEDAYAIHREGSVSSAPLSEGEKTALAFCYFITSINADPNHELKDMIIVIDDPISSLDNRHLHYAFNYMKQKCINARQLFIFTHNFSFFKEAQKSYTPRRKKDGTKPDTVSLLHIMVKANSTGSFSCLVPLPEAIRKHETEYHYFAEQVIYANDNGWNDPDLYGTANACRRVLECFLSFKIPSADNIRQKMDILIEGNSIESEKIKNAAKSRLLNLASHSDSLDKMLGLDNITLDSVKEAVEFTIDLLQNVDPVHFGALKKACR